MSQIHLTFDNGPHPTGTPLVLDALRRRGLPASFFVLGKHLATAEGAALAREIHDQGHRLGNHSYSHEIPLGDDDRPEAVALELERTQDLLDPIWAGPRWFRPFGGGGHLGHHLLSPASVAWLKAHRVTCALWNVVPGDWLDGDGWPAKATAQIEATPHAVVVLHDILPEAMAHLGGWLDRLTDAGHTFTDEWPAGCLPMRDGQAQPELARYIKGAQPP